MEHTVDKPGYSHLCIHEYTLVLAAWTHLPLCLIYNTFFI